MNDALYLSEETDLVVQALAALRTSAGIHGAVVPESGDGVDTRIVLQIGPHRLLYDCDVKKKIDRHAALIKVLNESRAPQSTLLVCSPLSHEMANRCRELDLQFIDTAGNAYLNDGHGVYVYVAGLRGQPNVYTTPNEGTLTPAAVKMIFAFLADPRLLNAPFRDIAARAMVSTGVIGKVFETLEARRLIGVANNRRLIRSPMLLLNEWTSGYLGRLKPKLRKYRFTTDDPGTFRAHWQPESKRSAWGGEVAAAHFTNHLQPEDFALYIDMDDRQALRDLVKEFRLRADPHGKIEVVQMFWNNDCFTEWFPNVPPHLVYADLIGSHDARNITVAQQLAAKVVKHVHDLSQQAN